MSYKLTRYTSTVIRLTDGTFIPEDGPGWTDYLTWVAGGGVPEPADGLTQGEIDYEGRLDEAQTGVKGWFAANPNAMLLFELSVTDLAQEISDLVDVSFPLLTNGQRTKWKLLLTGIALVVRVLARKSELY